MFCNLAGFVKELFGKLTKVSRLKDYRGFLKCPQRIFDAVKFILVDCKSFL